MAAPKTTHRMLILLGDGATPTEAFAFPCGASARSITLSTNTGEQEVLDCTSPLDAAATIERWVTTIDTSMQISGVIALPFWDKWREWADSGATKNIKVHIDETAVNGGGSWTLPAILSSLELAAESKGKVTFTASLTGAGARVWADQPVS